MLFFPPYELVHKIHNSEFSSFVCFVIKLCAEC
jgi:hypothetical protein